MVLGWFRRMLVALALLGAGLSLHAGDAAAKAVVSGARIGNHGQTTRFVLDLDQSVAFRVYTLAEPYRVLIDLPDLDWTAGAGRAGGFIKGFRYGTVKPGNSGVVIELAQPASVKEAFLIPPRDGSGWRFVLDLEGVTHQAFMQKQGAPADAPAPRPAAAKPTPAPQPAALTTPPPAPANTLKPPPPPQPAGLSTPPAPPMPKMHSKPIIALDPGHGGADPGAIGVSGIYEKQLTLTMAAQLKEELERRGRYKVVLTRDKDVFVPLRDRIARARAAGAELFISLHADALPDARHRGASVYTLSEKASDAEAQALADKENKADLIGGMDLSNESPEVTSILIDLAQRETMNHSATFAADLVDELARETKLLRNTHRFAGFAVLKAPDVPSVLIELGYLSNEQEERLLRENEYRAKLAAALARSVDRYFVNVQKAQRP